jgi:NADPH:quinone reductase-like Zn-dependent oxidoreductase
MKAIVYERYGSPDVLQHREIDKPSVTDSGVLVRVRAASVNPYDWHFMRGEPYFMRLMFGLRAPKRHGLGVDFAGVVEEVGKDVKEFRAGDEVFGLCDGAFAEYLCAPETDIARKPKNLSFEQAAAVPMGGLTALQGLRDTGQVQASQKVLIVGASGGVGAFAVQIAKTMGAHVTGVCSTAKLDFVRSLGADAVVDYTREDFANGNAKYDVIFQLAGEHGPFACRRALVPKGRLVLSSGDSDGRWIGPIDRILLAAAASPFVSQTLAALDVKRSRKDLEHLTTLIERGKLVPVIERTVSLGEVPDAIGSVEKRHTRGKIVVTI